MTARRPCGMLAAMRKLVLAGVLGLLGAACGGGDAPAGPEPTIPLKVMTRNLYLGADLLPVVTVMTVDEIPAKVAALWQTMQSSDLPGRARLLADEIAAAKPDLVALQEAVIFYKQVPSNFSFTAPANDATTVEFDFITRLLEELATRGAEFQTAAVLVNSDVELPAADPAGPFDVRMTDRIAIIARKGLPITGMQSAHYATHVPFSIPISAPMNAPRAPVDLVRGVLRVTATIDGAPFTFATTQLEVSGGPGDILRSYQEMQAGDLVRALEGVPGPLVLAGDLNSPAGAMTRNSYDTVAARFTDAWNQVNAGQPGFTCCTDLAAPQVGHQQRIDFVLHRGGVATTAVEVVGTDPARRTTPGMLWPARHAGLVATLKIAKSP